FRYAKKQFACIVSDITERRKADEERKKLQTQLANAVELAHLGHWEYDVVNDLFTFNDQFYKIFHTTAEEVGGYTMPSAEYAKRFIHPDDLNVVGEEIQKVIQAADPDFKGQLEHRIVYADGGIGHISVQHFVEKDADGRTVRTYGVNQDITDRKRIEEQLRQAQKMESIGNLAGGIAHDFNNILFPIVGMAEMLLEDLPMDSPEYENALEILNAGKRGSDLVKQILAFSRQSEHKMIPVRIQQVLKEVLKLIRATIPSNIEIVQDIQADCGLVLADPIQIHQVAMNLITNAYHAVEEKGGQVAVGLRAAVLGGGSSKAIGLEPGAYAILTISDDGAGMDDATMHKIFEPYFTTKERGKGTGLGLAVVYGIVKEHALKAFMANPTSYDLVISDMTMPNMTGDQLARELRAINSRVPIIICTGFSERINKEKAEAAGIKALLMKPIVRSDLARMVRKVLDEAKDENQ
ncbi:MAG: response regulator, partial [Desulfosarcinaceae bacterium]